MQRRFYFSILILLSFQNVIFSQKVKESFVVVPKKSTNQHQASPQTNTAPPKKTQESFVSPAQITNQVEEQPRYSEIKGSGREQMVEEYLKSKDQIDAAKRQISVPMQKPAKTPVYPLSKPAFVPIDAIVLDAGHGGKDPGGIANAIEEKRLVLTLVKKIHALFRSNDKDLSIYVTRKSDNFVSLEERVSKTARWSTKKNILFVSVHGNIAFNKKVEGLEIYTLSDKASDPEALEVERLENAGFTVEDIRQTDTLYSILADLVRDSTRKQSEWLARYVYDDMLRSGPVLGRGLKKANFFVLKYNTVPSILIEVGYMSSPSESRKLKSEDYQNNLAEGIFKGVSRFIEEYNKTEGFTR